MNRNCSNGNGAHVFAPEPRGNETKSSCNGIMGRTRDPDTPSVQAMAPPNDFVTPEGFRHNNWASALLDADWSRVIERAADRRYPTPPLAVRNSGVRDRQQASGGVLVE